MVERVRHGQVLENVVVGSQRRRRHRVAEDGVGRVVERVRGHQGTAVNAARQHELDLGDPLLHGLGLGLRTLVVLLEVVRKVAIQVETAGIVSERLM